MAATPSSTTALFSTPTSPPSSTTTPPAATASACTRPTPPRNTGPSSPPPGSVPSTSSHPNRIATSTKDPAAPQAPAPRLSRPAPAVPPRHPPSTHQPPPPPPQPPPNPTPTAGPPNPNDRCCLCCCCCCCPCLSFCHSLRESASRLCRCLSGCHPAGIRFFFCPCPCLCLCPCLSGCHPAGIRFFFCPCPCLSFCHSLRESAVCLSRRADIPSTQGATYNSLGMSPKQAPSTLPEAGVKPQAKRPNCLPLSRRQLPRRRIDPPSSYNKNKSHKTPPKTAQNPHVNPPPPTKPHKTRAPTADFSPTHLAYLPHPTRYNLTRRLGTGTRTQLLP